MKTKVPFLFFALVLALFLQSFGDPYFRKRITDKQFKYEFYTTDKKVRAKSNVVYYWFKGGAIHTSEEGIAGELLNEEFDKYYLNNQLAEKGVFRNGKKVGLWKTWHPNGMLATEQEWAGGQKNGNFIAYNENGDCIEKGMYRANKKQGTWTNLVTKTTLKYKNDVVVVKKPKKQKAVKEEPKEAKEKQNTNDTESKKDSKKESKSKETKSKKDATTQPKKPTDSKKKDGFFKRLFSKKDKTKKANAKGS